MRSRRGSVGALALDVIRGQLGELEQRAASLRQGSGEEDVHQARVAMRRIRSALGLFRDHLAPSWLDVRDDLRWSAGALGLARDLDVQIARMRSWLETGEVALEGTAVLDALVAQRQSAEEELREAMASERFEVLVRSLRRRLTTPPPPSDPAPKVISKLIAKRMARLHDQTLTLRPGAAPADYHRARILAKRLRYAAEFAVPVLGKSAGRLARAVVPVQDQLGWHQDAEVARNRLQAIADGRPDLAFACGVYAQAYHRLTMETERLWRGPYRALRREWKRLSRKF